ncbi:MerC domain-containing protein [Sphingomonas oleivorans]|nr:MerC domain-containing protein [Sphingomonas oleivorans]
MEKRTNLLEGAAMAASLLCLVHCLILPLAIALLPAFTNMLRLPESFHYLALGFVIPFAALAFLGGWRVHGTPLPTLLGGAGVALLTVALLPGRGEIWETGLTVAGSLLLMGGHGINWRMRAQAHGCM